MRLLRTAVLAAALALSLTGLAHAQYELTWDKCPGSFGAVTNKRYDCATEPAQPMQLVVAFTPQKSLPRFVGIRIDIEVASSTGNLPDWWRAGIGECREGAVTTTLSPGQALGECRNPWLGSQTGGGSYWATGFGGSGRTLMSFAFARVDKTSLVSGTRYLAAVINVDGSSTSSCSGCGTEMCLAITKVEIAQEKDPNSRYDEPGPDDQITVTSSTGTSIASFNSTNPGNACGSKVRNKTWGTVKATYR